MKNLFRACLAAGVITLAILVIAIGSARYTTALSPRAHLILFVTVVVAYFVPSALALYRNCTATLWIAALNIVLGWSLFGWVIALGWAARGRKRILPAASPVPPIPPVAGH